MENRSFKIGAALYAVLLLVNFAGVIVPIATGKPWAPQTQYLLRVLAMGIMILSGGLLFAYVFQAHRSSSVPAMPWRKHEDPVQSHIIRHAEDVYRQQGYCNQGSFGAGHIALQFSVDEKDPLVQDAMLALVEAGKLVPHQTPTGTAYALPAARQMEMITQLDLSYLWECRGARFFPNDVLFGEIQRVERAVAAQQHKQVNP